MPIPPDIAGAVLRVAARFAVGPAVPLAMAATLMETSDTIDAVALERRLLRNGGEFLALQAALLAPAEDPVVGEARRAAADSLAQGRFGDADRSLAKAELHLLAGLSDLSALPAARRIAVGTLRGERGTVALLTLGPRGAREAAQRFGEATALIGLTDAGLSHAQALRQGDALLRAGTDAGDAPAIDQAVAHFRRLLQGLDNFEDTVAWAAVQERLAAGLVAAHEQGDGPGSEKLAEAAACCRLALEDLRQAQAPELWARLQRRLGELCLRLAPANADADLAEEAVQALRAALGAARPDEDVESLTQLRFDLAQALALHGTHTGGMAELEGAFNSFSAVVHHWTRADHPARWSQVHDRMGAVLVRMAQRYSESVVLEEAVAAYGAALEERPRETAPLLWADSAASQALAMVDLARKERDPAMAQRALGQLMAAAETLKGAGRNAAALDLQKKLVAAAAAVEGLRKA